MYGGDAQKEQEGGIIAELASKLGLDQEEEAECWPEHWLTLQIFVALSTQWNVVHGGYVGLRYEVLPVVLDEFGVKPAERAALISDLRVMEIEALQVINKR